MASAAGPARRGRRARPAPAPIADIAQLPVENHLLLIVGVMAATLL